MALANQPTEDVELLNRSLSTPIATSKSISFYQKCCRCCPDLPESIKRHLPRILSYIARIIACFSVWAATWSIVGNDALPGGNIFSIYILLVFSAFGGYLAHWNIGKFSLPPLLGMLLVGFILRNVPGIAVANHIIQEWSSTLRSVALVVILLRSGLGLDIAALRRLKFTVIRLAFTPCLVEASVVAVVSHLMLGLPWLWALQLGFILGAVSPAVVVPSMLALHQIGYGVREGIPTMVMAASSCDDVLAISLFGVFLGIAFSQGNLIFNIFRGPLEIVMGITIGLVIGILLWYLPNSKQASVSSTRTVLLLSIGLFFLFGSNLAEFSGAGALGVLTVATTAGYGWGDEAKAPIERVMGILWTFFQPLLFGLIGAEVRFEYLDKDLVGLGIACLLIALAIRIVVTYFVVLGSGLSVKERMFCAIAWLPKATVQAAIGSIPLDTARNRGYAGQEQEKYGIQIVTIAVLAILLTAPTGAVAISLTGTRWLKNVNDNEATGTDDPEMPATHHEETTDAVVTHEKKKSAEEVTNVAGV